MKQFVVAVEDHDAYQPVEGLDAGQEPKIDAQVFRRGQNNYDLHHVVGQQGHLNQLRRQILQDVGRRLSVRVESIYICVK